MGHTSSWSDFLEHLLGLEEMPTDRRGMIAGIFLILSLMGEVQNGFSVAL